METVSVIITVHNGQKWVDKCFCSILGQTVLEKKLVNLEISIYDDSSYDETLDEIQKWKSILEISRVKLIIQQSDYAKPKGVGYGRNRAIEMSTGQFLCFQDIDDEMFPERIEKQYLLASIKKDAIIGSKFTRLPPNSTCRFTTWANNLTNEQLRLQIYTANGPTIIMPTWFCHRNMYEKIIGGFCELGHGTPEDLIFFYQHIDQGGAILRIDDFLLKYRYHPDATTFSVKAETIWHIRLKHLLANILAFKPWSDGFTIWNAGKHGRRFFRNLPNAIKSKVLAFCDVDKKKINKTYHYYDKITRKETNKVPIVHFTNAKRPLLICMKLNLTKGDFESNLKSLNLIEGKDYILFT